MPTPNDKRPGPEWLRGLDILMDEPTYKVPWYTKCILFVKRLVFKSKYPF